jgi:uncharacterized protein YecE (DUF72 family)
MKIYTGTSGYSYKQWKGNFYPEKLPADKMLAAYSKRLTTVEINNTFYRMPIPSVVDLWKEQVGSGFLFAVKAPQIITHIHRLKNVREETKFFLHSVSELGKKLGAVLFQFPASFKVNTGLLGDFLDLIPAKIPCAFDFRSGSWMTPETYALLKARNFCLCMEDTDENPVQEIVGTSDWGYLRLRRLDYTDQDLSKWAKKVLAMEWKKAFIFFKHEDDEAVKSPDLAIRFMSLASGGPVRP